MKDDECAKLVSAGTTITPEMEYEIEKMQSQPFVPSLKRYFRDGSLQVDLL